MNDAAPRDDDGQAAEVDHGVDHEVDCEVDAIGLTCPMPLLKAKRALNGLAGGGTLRVRATDPGSVRDFEVFCERSGHELLASTTETADAAAVYVHLIRKQWTA